LQFAITGECAVDVICIVGESDNFVDDSVFAVEVSSAFGFEGSEVGRFFLFYVVEYSFKFVVAFGCGLNKFVGVTTIGNKLRASGFRLSFAQGAVLKAEAAHVVARDISGIAGFNFGSTSEELVNGSGSIVGINDLGGLFGFVSSGLVNNSFNVFEAVGLCFVDRRELIFCTEFGSIQIGFTHIHD
jgi:hypothetical protein